MALHSPLRDMSIYSYKVGIVPATTTQENNLNDHFY